MPKIEALKKYQSSGLLSPERENPLIDAVNEALRELNIIPPRDGRQPHYHYLWMAWDAGPNAEADYTDHRYWIRLCRVSNDAASAATDAAKFLEFSDDTHSEKGYWLTATNTSERPASTGGTESAGAHSLVKGTIITNLHVESDAVSTVRYVFESDAGGAAACGSQYQAKYAVVANVMACDWARFH